MRIQLSSIGISRLPGATRKLLFLSGVSFFLGRTVVAESLSPLGPAMFAACRLVVPEVSLAAAVACIIGAATVGIDHLMPICAALVAETIFLRKPSFSRSRINLNTTSTIAAGSMFLGRLAYVRGGITVLSVLTAAADGVSAGLATALFSYVLSNSVFENDQFSRFQPLLVMVMSLSVIAGTGGISIGRFTLQRLFGLCATAVAGASGGPSVGSCVGLGTGIIGSLTGGWSPGFIGFLGIAGLLCGVGGWFGPVEALAGFLAGSLTVLMWAGRDLEVPLFEVGVAALAALVSSLKVGKSQLIGSLFRTAKDGELPRRNRENNHAYADYSEIGKMLAGIGGLIESSSAKTVTYDGAVFHDEKDIVRYLTMRICEDCAGKRECWELNTSETISTLQKAARDILSSLNESRHANLSGCLDRCLRHSDFAREAAHLVELQRLSTKTASLRQELMVSVAAQYRHIGQLLSAARSRDGADQGKPELHVSIRGKSVPAEGCDEPGDVWLRYDIDSSKTLVVLVDGMGKGTSAARQSQVALDILKKLLDLGFDYNMCMSFVNSALSLAFGSEIFIALDCLLVDSCTERAYFYKLGAPPSFIRKSDGNVIVVRGSRPPIGAARYMPVYGTNERVGPGDTIVMVSDGIFRASPVPARTENLVMSRLSRLKDPSPEACVKTLLGPGNFFAKARVFDDISVVAVGVDGFGSIHKSAVSCDV